MTTQHSRQEMETLASLVTTLHNLWGSQEPSDRLIKVMLNRFAIDLNNRLLLHQPRYKLKWHPERALAFAAAVQAFELTNAHSYEGVICLKLYHQTMQYTLQ